VIDPVKTYQTERVSLKDLRPADYNPRSISDAALEGLAKSMSEFGIVEPIIWNRRTGHVVGGHQRLKVMQKQGLAEADVIVVDLTEAKERALNVALNSPTIAGEFTDDLDALLLSIQESEPDLFEELLLAELLTDVGQIEVVEDEAPEPPDEPVTQRGDLWVLGRHRLLCGDSASTDDVDRLLGGVVIDLVNTDPPYNVKVEPRSNNAIAAGNSSFSASKKGGHHQKFDVARHPEKAKATHRKMRAKDRPLENDFVTDEAFDEMLLAWFGNAARVLRPGGSFYIWGGYANLGNYPAPLKASGLYFSQAIIWDKQHPVLTRKDFMGAFEVCFYGWKEGAAHQFFGPNNVTDLWAVKKVNPQSMVHLTEKPLELAARAIQYSSKKGEHVLDLFGGSGSTLMACEQMDRHAYLMELDPAYADVIVQRWQAATGEQAVREGDGVAFNEVTDGSG
jgi:DNA modification methylase